MDNQYRVEWYMDNTYRVIEIETEQTVFKGSLSDCEAFIRLTEKGYM